MTMRLAVVAVVLGVIAAPAQPIEELLQLGMRALEAEDFKGAEQMFSELVKKAPTAENIGYLAIAEAGNGKSAQAITHFRQAIRMGNNTAIMHQSLGLAYLSDNKPEPGIRELKQAYLHAICLRKNQKKTVHLRHRKYKYDIS